MNLALKPHVIGFVATLLLIASVASAIDRPGGDAGLGVTIDAAGPSEDASEDEAVAAPTRTPRGSQDAASEDASEADVEGASPQPGTRGGQTGTTGGTTGATNGGTTGGTTGSTTGGTAGTTGGTTGGTSGGTTGSTAPTYPEANLYSDDEKFRGITDERITFCGHAALALAAAFNTSEADLNVYWEMVTKEQGGVYGRDVVMTWEDDAYAADKAVLAAEACAGKDPFLILGGIGFDQIPKVRTWAEDNSELYVHHIAVAPDRAYDYSYSLSPTVQAIGEQFGNHIAGSHAGKKIGILYRQSDNWTPGHDAGLAVLKSRGVEVVGDYPVVQNQGAYSVELNQLRSAGAEVVWVWENALNAAQIINQATEQGYRPTWVVFPFQTTIDTLRQPNTLTIDGVAAWPSYAPSGYGGAFPEYEYDAEIARFEAAYAKYRPGVKPNDLLWQVWLGNKILHRMLRDCGADCNRNRFAGMMLSGYQAHEKPGCPIDFSDSRSFGGHITGFAYFSQQLYQHSDGSYQYRTTRYCAPSLG